MIALYLKFFIALFAVINPIGVMPVISNLTEGFDKKEQKMVVKTTTVAIFTILIVSLFLGQIILNIFSISLNSFRIAGGILITLIAFTMINGKLTEEKQNKEEKQDINNIKNFAVVPLAIPILAGPGAISTTIMWGAKYNNWIDLLGLSVAIVAFSLLCYVLFRSSSKLFSYIGKTGANVVTRIMGLILMAIGIEVLTTATVQFYIINLQPIVQ
jgi:membrane protein, marC family